MEVYDSNQNCYTVLKLSFRDMMKLLLRKNVVRGGLLVSYGLHEGSILPCGDTFHVKPRGD